MEAVDAAGDLIDSIAKIDSAAADELVNGYNEAVGMAQFAIDQIQQAVADSKARSVLDTLENAASSIESASRQFEVRPTAEAVAALKRAVDSFLAADAAAEAAGLLGNDRYDALRERAGIFIGSMVSGMITALGNRAMTLDARTGEF
jgi:hypothetical protein